MTLHSRPLRSALSRQLAFSRAAALALVLPLGLAAVSTALTPAFAQEAAVKNERFITVQGSGSVSAVPDKATLSGGVTTDAETAADALASNSKALNAVLVALKDAGVEAKDIQTSNFSVQPRYGDYTKSGPSGLPKIEGYQVSNTVSVRVNDLERLGPLLDTMVTSGANTINGINFEVTGANEKRDAAREAAVTDARRKAELFAKASGAKLGRVMSMSEGGDGGVRPMYRMATMAMEAAPAPAPVMAGEETLYASVTIVYELVD
ncbi:SIMPL domain-containing protein [Pannonibacter indicus]|uniref:SIMPL domain-containing protein n=1 Tax=Pannonibacter indicus TaxID=466044 RepID=UPI0035B4CAD0